MSLIDDNTFIVLHNDGNVNDTDDISSLIIEGLLIRASGNKSKTKLFFNNNLCETSVAWQVAAERASADFVRRLGIEIFDYEGNNAATTAALADILDSGSKVLVLEGGPCEASYRAMQLVSPANRPKITFLHHSNWNRTRAVITRSGVTAAHTLNNMKSTWPSGATPGVTGPTYIDIIDQNDGTPVGQSGTPLFESPDWSWMDTAQPLVLQEGRSLMRNATGNVNDASDAGMVYYAATGDDHGNPTKVKTYITVTNWANMPQTWPEVNNFASAISIDSGTGVLSVDASSLFDAETLTVYATDGVTSDSATLSVSVSEPTATVSGLYVATTGSDTTGDGSQADPWRTPQKAANSAVPGDTIWLRAGTYAPFEFNVQGTSTARIYLKPFAGETVTISGDPNNTGVYGYGPRGKGGIEIDGKSYITIDGTGGTIIVEKIGNPGSGGGSGVWVQGSVGGTRGITIKNVKTQHTENCGIAAAGLWFGSGSPAPDEYRLFDLIIDGCDVSDTNNPAHEAWSAGSDGAGNECISVGGGLDGFQIINCYVHHSKQYGIDAKLGAINGLIADNHVEFVRKHGIYIDPNTRRNRNIEILRNTLNDCHNNGIVLARENSSQSIRAPRVPNLHEISIRDNVIYDCGRGILCDDHQNDTIGTGGNGYGLYSDIEIINNTIYRNNNANQTQGNWGALITAGGTGADTSNWLLANNIIYSHTSGNLSTDIGADLTQITNLMTNPTFVNTASTPPDLHLQASSAAKDAGTDGDYVSDTDFEGTARGTPPNIGAYE